MKVINSYQKAKIKQEVLRLAKEYKFRSIDLINTRFSESEYYTTLTITHDVFNHREAQHQNFDFTLGVMIILKKYEFTHIVSQSKFAKKKEL